MSSRERFIGLRRRLFCSITDHRVVVVVVGVSFVVVIVVSCCPLLVCSGDCALLVRKFVCVSLYKCIVAVVVMVVYSI